MSDNVFDSEADGSCYETEVVRKHVPRVKTRAKTAKDLVRRQEELVTMLQKMRSDISKMDREASSIKEDVVRSNQLLNVMVHMKQTHHLTPSLDGFNLSYSFPRVTYNFHNRKRFSSFRPSSTSSRHSSISSQYSRQHDRSDLDRSQGHARGNHSRSTASSAIEDSYSGTESEYEGSNTRHWSRNSNVSDIDLGSDEGQAETAGSSTESVSSFGRISPEVNPRMHNNQTRRQSYFYVQDRREEIQGQSDEVDV